MCFYLAVVAVGGLLAIGGQTWVCHIFGGQWADAVVQPGEHAWPAAKYGEVLFSKSLGAMGVAATTGLMLASVLARWAVAPGHSCFGAFVWLVWLVVAVLTFVPLLMVDGFEFVSVDSFTTECTMFADNDPNHVGCRARWYFFVVGGGLLVLVLVLMTCAGVQKYMTVCCEARDRGSTEDLDQPVARSVFRRMRNANLPNKPGRTTGARAGSAKERARERESLLRV